MNVPPQNANFKDLTPNPLPPLPLRERAGVRGINGDILGNCGAIHKVSPFIRDLDFRHAKLFGSR